MTSWYERLANPPPKARRWSMRRLAIYAGIATLVFFLTRDILATMIWGYDDRPYELNTLDLETMAESAATYAKAVEPPYGDRIHEVGHRLKELSLWLSDMDKINQWSATRRQVADMVELVVRSLLPSLQRVSTSSPLGTLRSSFESGSQGIVIPIGSDPDDLRFAGHLISSLRDSLACPLPIQVIYAGGENLSDRKRKKMRRILETRGVSFMDLYKVFDDATLDLINANRHIVKPFAALAARFEQVIVLDANAVFIQSPEVLLQQKTFTENGAHLFHDRSPALQLQAEESLLRTTDRPIGARAEAEQVDTGVLVLDKSRNDVLMGMIHAAWQNTAAVRQDLGTQTAPSDKSSWLQAMETTGSRYGLGQHYGSILGWNDVVMRNDTEVNRVCGPGLAHVDENGNLVWYGGALLDDRSRSRHHYKVPEAWMVDGQWEDGPAGEDMACMNGGETRTLTKHEQILVSRNIHVAKRFDRDWLGM
jgi:alpha 1,3-mannosyltransferase